MHASMAARLLIVVALIAAAATPSQAIGGSFQKPYATARLSRYSDASSIRRQLQDQGLASLPSGSASSTSPGPSPSSAPSSSAPTPSASQPPSASPSGAQAEPPEPTASSPTQSPAPSPTPLPSPPPPINPPPPPNPPAPLPYSCPSSPLEFCDFFFQGYSASLPVFDNLAMLPTDAPFGPPIMSSLVQLPVEVHSSGKGTFLCPSDGHWSAGNQFYLTNSMLQVRTFQQALPAP